MAKKIGFRCVLIVLAGALVFFLSYLASYKITQNKYKVEAARESASTQTQAQTAAPTSAAVPAAPAEEEPTEPPAPFDAAKLATPREIAMPEDDTWPLVVINQFYKIKASYEPFVEQVLPNSAIYLDQRVAQAFRGMYNAALADGIELTLSAGYVSPERQDRNFEKQVQAYMEQGMDRESAQANAAFLVLPAGCSESNYGLAVDIGWPEDDFKDSPAYAWLKLNAANYGFVERYPAEKVDVTHFHAEPWHWRYVGITAAQAMAQDGLCLEEYRNLVNLSVDAAGNDDAEEEDYADDDYAAED